MEEILDTGQTKQDFMVDTADRLLTDVLPNLSADSAQIVKRLMVDSAPNALKDIIISGLAENVRTQSAGLKNRAVVSISEVLGESEKVLLSLYPELNIRFERKSYVSHAFASASRKCERAVLYARAGYDKDADFLAHTGLTGKDVYIKEMGGDPLRSIIGRERSVHHCAPVLSSYDQTRVVSRRTLAVSRLTNPVISEAERHGLQQYLLDSETKTAGKLCCFSKSQDCNVKATVLIALHSVYDVTLSEFGDAMDSAGVDIAYGTLLYDSNMFLSNVGELSVMGATYSYPAPFFNGYVDNHMLDIGSVHGRIYFNFRGDDGFNYEHDFQTYAAWLTCSKFKSTLGNTFNLEMMENRGGAQFFKVTRDLYPSDFAPVPRTLWLGAENKMLVTFYDIDVAAAVFGSDPDPVVGRPLWDRDLEASQLKLMRFFVDKRLVEYVLEFARGVGESHFKPDAVFNFLRAKGSKVMYSGAVTEEYHGLSLQQMSALSMVIYLVVYEVKYRHGKILRSLMTSLSHQREHCYQNMAEIDFDNVVKWDDGFGRYPWFKSFFMWLTRSGKYSEGHIAVDQMLIPGTQYCKMRIGPSSSVAITRSPLVVSAATDPSAFNKAIAEHFGVPIDKFVCSGSVTLGLVDYSQDGGVIDWVRSAVVAPVAAFRARSVDSVTIDYSSVNARLRSPVEPKSLIALVAKYDALSGRELSSPDNVDTLIEEFVVCAPSDVYSYIRKGRGFADTFDYYHKDTPNVVHLGCLDTINSDYVECRTLIETIKAATLLVRFDVSESVGFARAVAPTAFRMYTQCAYVFPDDDMDSSCLMVCKGLRRRLCTKMPLYFEHFITMVKGRVRYLAGVVRKRALLELKTGPLKPKPRASLSWIWRLVNWVLSLFRRIWRGLKFYNCNTAVVGGEVIEVPDITISPPNELEVSELSEDSLVSTPLVTANSLSEITGVCGDVRPEYCEEKSAIDFILDCAWAEIKMARELGDADPDIITLQTQEVEEVTGPDIQNTEVTRQGRDVSCSLGARLEEEGESSSSSGDSGPELPALPPASVRVDEQDFSGPVEVVSMVYHGGGVAPYFRHSTIGIYTGCANLSPVRRVSGQHNGCCVRAVNMGRSVDVVGIRSSINALNISPLLDSETAANAMAGDDFISYWSGLKRVTYKVYSSGRCTVFDNDYSWMSVSLKFANLHYDLHSACTHALSETDEIPTLTTDQVTSILRVTGAKASREVVSNEPFLWHSFVEQCYDGFYCRNSVLSKFTELESVRPYKCVLVLPKQFMDHVDLVVKRPWVVDVKLDPALLVIMIDSEKPCVVGMHRGLSNVTGAYSGHSQICDSLSGLVTLAAAPAPKDPNLHTVRVLPHCDAPKDFKVALVQKVDCDRTDVYVKANDGHLVEIVGLTDCLVSELVHLQGLRTALVTSTMPNLARVVAAVEHYCRRVDTAVTGRAVQNHFDPKFQVDVKPGSFLYNAMEEQRALWSQEADVVTKSLGRDLPAAEAFVQGIGTLGAVTDTSLLIYDLKQAKFVNSTAGRSIDEYQWGMTTQGLVHTKEFFSDMESRQKTVKRLLNHGCRVLVFSSKSKLIHGIQLRKLYSSVNLNTIDFTKYDLRMVQGVPGAGKSHTILSRNMNRPQNLILTVSREGREDLERRARTMGLGFNHSRIRTVDSFLLNPTSDADEVWLDEALMKHCGSWMWVYHLSGCRRMYVVGDRAQIPYIERSGVVTKYSIVQGLQNVEYLSTSYRCPLDIVKWLNDLGCYHPEKVWGCSEVDRSVTYSVVHGVSQVPRVDGAKYLTFTQAEKDSLSREGYDVNTVHEYQGNQKADVILVRLEVKEANKIYSSEPHILVALTRHTSSFRYITVRRDVVVAHCEKIVAYSKSSLDEVFRTKGGGRYVIVEEESNYDGLTKACALAMDTAVSPVSDDKLVLDLLVEHDSSSYLTTSVERTWKLEVDNYSGYCSNSADVSVLQAWLDGVLPGVSCQDRQFDHQLFEMSEIVADLDQVVLNRSYALVKEREYITPMLRTSILPKVPTTQKQVVKAFIERNGNVPRLQGEVDDGELADILLRDLLRTCSRHSFSEQLIMTDFSNLDDWLRSQPPATRKALKTQMCTIHLCDRRFDAYDFMLKNVPKPELEIGGERRYKSPQTIAYQSKDINSLFSPVMKELMNRIISVIHPDFLFYNGVTPECFAAMVTDRMPHRRARTLHKFTEIDFSKYDKSQGLVVLLFEINVMREFGVPQWLIAVWVKMHKVTWLFDHGSGFKAKVEYQRKSGDAGTWRFNTLVLVAVLNSELRLYDKLREGKCVALFSGDDSVIFSDEDLIASVEAADRFPFKYNLETKLMKYRLPYFCSKFLVNTIDGWVFVPDTVKMLIKLGRLDLVDMQHVEEYRVSFKDGLIQYRNPINWMAISAAINDRYKVAGEHDIVFMTLLGVCESKESFATLYRDERVEKLEYVTRPKLEL